LAHPDDSITYWFVVNKHGAEVSRISAEDAMAEIAEIAAKGGDWQAVKFRLMQELDRAQRRA